MKSGIIFEHHDVEGRDIFWRTILLLDSWMAFSWQVFFRGEMAKRTATFQLHDLEKPLGDAWSAAWFCGVKFLSVKMQLL